MADRVIASGDVHGCSAALRRLIEVIQPDARDTVVTLGDYINRGPDSRGVINQLISLREQCNYFPLLGNHDQLLLLNRTSRTEISGHQLADMECGLEQFRDEHFEFLKSCGLYFEISTHFFVHANYEAKKQLAQQDDYTLLWQSLDTRMPKRHCSRKTAIVGHTSQRNGEILDRGHLKCIDTYCHGGGWLTALDVRSGRTWQVDQNGMVR
jgi:serine/threonine protein phosphatase 1